MQLQHVPRARVVAHIDLDCFYCQVEVSRDPSLRGKPVAVIQYNPWDREALKKALRPDDARIFNDSNGSIIAVSYEARAFGVKRNMSGQEARRMCPEIQLVQVPTAHGKADLTIYRKAGQQVAAILARGSMCERASIDEAYLDLTDAANRLLQQQQQQQQHGPTSSSCSSLDGGAVGAAAAAAAVGPGAGLVAPGPPPSVPRCLEGWHVLGLEDEADLDAAAAASLHSDEEDEQGEGQEEEQAEEGQGAEEQSIRAEALAGGVGLAGSEAPQGPGLPAGGQDEAAASGVSEEHRGGPLAFQRGNGDGYEPAMPTTSSSSRQWDGGGGGGSGSTRVHGSTAAAAEGSPAPPHATPTRIRPNASSLGATAPGGGAAAAPPTTPEAVRAQRQREAVRSQERQQRLRAYWGRPAYQWDGYERLLFAGAVVVSELREAVRRELGFTCSAGVAHYKVLAKLASGLHKPNQQTVVLERAVPGLLRPLPIARLRSLGGKFGQELQERLGVKTVGELWAVPQSRLEALFGQEAAAGVARLAAGMDDGEVTPRMAPKSLSCGKTFRGSSALKDMAQVQHWLLELARELSERIEADRQEHERVPQLLTVSVTGGGGAAGGGAAGGGAAAGEHVQMGNHSRSGKLQRVGAEAIAEVAGGLLRKWAAERPGWRITAMYIAASNFGAAPTGASTITRFLQQPPASGTQHKRQRINNQQQQPPSDPQTEGVFLQPPFPGAGPADARPTTSAVSGSLSNAGYTAGAGAGGLQLPVAQGLRSADLDGSGGGDGGPALRRSPFAEPPVHHRRNPPSSARSSGSAGRVDGGGVVGGKSQGGAAQLQQQRSQGRGRGRGSRAASPGSRRGGGFADLRSLLLAGGGPGRLQQQIEPQQVLRASSAYHGISPGQQGEHDTDEDSDGVEVVEVVEAQGPGAQRPPQHPHSTAGTSPAPAAVQPAGTRAGTRGADTIAAAPAGSVITRGESPLPPPPAAAVAAAATATATALDSQERPASLEPAIATLEDWLGDPSAAEPLWLGSSRGGEGDPAPHHHQQQEQQEQHQLQLRPAPWPTGPGPACGTEGGLQRPGGAARSQVESHAAVGAGAGTERQARCQYSTADTPSGPMGAMTPAAVHGSAAPRAVGAVDGRTVRPGCAAAPRAGPPGVPQGVDAPATGGVPGGGVATVCAEVEAEVDEQVLAELPRHIQEEVRRGIWAAGGSLHSGPRDPGRGGKPDRRTVGAKRARDNQQQQQQLDIRRFAGK